MAQRKPERPFALAQEIIEERHLSLDELDIKIVHGAIDADEILIMIAEAIKTDRIRRSHD